MFNEKADVIRLATGGPLSRDEAHSIKEHVNQLKQIHSMTMFQIFHVLVRIVSLSCQHVQLAKFAAANVEENL
ncbi:hypothetical protein EB796_009934 [Bugula neritina]|uniref:Uncharacterized protein n=1 Tax=Bugula neritina TaxID=10212 RepID=A0A7J7K0L4_BUGNE|nr:hypothetical protein EB796_009934 [Bugula neritina]